MRKPNLRIPLASSYNERGLDGLLHAISNSESQRKLNCFYEISKNPITGNSSLSLTKRPGITVQSPAGAFGVSAQAAYFLETPPAFSVGSAWVFSTDSVSGPIHKVSDQNTTTTIYSSSSAAAYIPIFLDRTLISGVDTLVYQIKNTSPHIAQKAFYTGTSASIGAAWNEITDADFTSIIHTGKIEHMDGYAFIIGEDSKIYNSDLNSLSSWTAANFITKQIVQDLPLGLVKFKNQILAFGEKSFEVFYNAGNPSGSPLSPIKQLQQKVGISDLIFTQISTNSTYAVEILGKLYFLGSASGGPSSTGLYVYNGSEAVKISPPYIDKIFWGEPNPNLSMGVFGFGGHNAIYFLLGSRFITSTGSSASWLMYFPEWNEWFEWTSSKFSPINNGRYFLGSGSSTTIYKFNVGALSDNFTDNGANYQSMTQFKLPPDGSQLHRMMYPGVIADTYSVLGSNILSVEISDDDYKTFTTLGSIDLGSKDKTLVRAGAYRERVMRLTATNDREIRLHAFVANITLG